MSKPDFVGGIYLDESPKEFVVVKMRLNVERFQQFLDNPYVKDFAKKNNGYINMDILKSKNGKLYIPFSEFIPEKKVTTTEHNPDRELDEVPF
jgi:hypothetical protein|tara:strand:- start:727 stop:1005 length:279 start_codon:yes stop_codon:yes gene_type:complete